MTPIWNTLGFSDIASGGSTERAVASILAGAVGDAFGYEIEFDRRPAIHERFGPRGLVEPVRHNGKLIVSDDTQMTLFTLEGLIRAQKRDLDGKLDAIREAYLDWHVTQQDTPQAGNYEGLLGAQPVMWHARAPGGTCLSALAAGGRGTPEHPLNGSKGCGGVMRVAPVGVMPGLGDAATRFDLAQRAAALTHGHPGGYRPAAAMAVLLCDLINGNDLATSLDSALSYLGSAVEGDDTARLITQARCLATAPDADHDRNIARLGQGWVGDEAIAVAVYAALAADTFEEALAISANHDGDSDSTASLAGQIWGAHHGLAAIPEDWIDDLDLFETMLPLLRWLIWPDDRPQVDTMR